MVTVPSGWTISVDTTNRGQVTLIANDPESSESRTDTATIDDLEADTPPEAGTS
jgi:hypothetical protein